MKKHEQQGSAHIFIITGIIALLVGALGFIFWKQVTTGGPGEACKIEGTIRLCISSSLSEMTSSDTATITTTITNVGFIPVTKTFSCTFTEPSVITNDSDVDGVISCGQAISSRTIEAFTTKSFTKELSGSKLKTGANSLHSEWSGQKSGDVTINKKAITEAELVKQFETCQTLPDNVKSQAIPDVCGTVSVFLNKSSNDYECSDWRVILKPIGLTIPCREFMDSGSAFVYVPRESMASWVSKLESLPEVDTVFDF